MIGVLLVNLGTPAAPTARAVRRYLAEFLSDRRVIELPPWLWQPILHGIILRTRPARSARLYAAIWGEAGSPLAAIAQAQSGALQGAFGPKVLVDHAMRYGQPTIAGRIAALVERGCDRILLAPLYPQYCAATTASATDCAFAAVAGLRWQPALRVLPAYYDNPCYIAALAESVREGLAALPFAPDLLIASFHGMPVRSVVRGDPYHRHCLTTAHLLARALGRDVRVSFQSRFGRGKWLEPETKTLLAQLPGQGVRRIAVIAPGFAADCIETLEELAMRGQKIFHTAGGSDFACLPCLNAGAIGMAMLREVIGRELAGWSEDA